MERSRFLIGTKYESSRAAIERSLRAPGESRSLWLHKRNSLRVKETCTILERFGGYGEG